MGDRELRLCTLVGDSRVRVLPVQGIQRSSNERDNCYGLLSSHSNVSYLWGTGMSVRARLPPYGRRAGLLCIPSFSPTHSRARPLMMCILHGWHLGGRLSLFRRTITGALASVAAASEARVRGYPWVAIAWLCSQPGTNVVRLLVEGSVQLPQ
eukprot:GHVU01211237.1.p1 GENE.GHVU01211237.1~~GHVU01211237.1.p1  ORF type:complete len:153 (+),score=2.95 GHVU01211237.1:706-1164(+)